MSCQNYYIHVVYKVVVAASLHSDNLYHPSDLSPLLHEKYRSRTGAQELSTGLQLPDLTRSSEDLIKWIVKSGVCDGLGYTYALIKHLQLPLCDACMIPPTITTSTYGIFEYLTVS
jgi:hypothetical protein